MGLTAPSRSAVAERSFVESVDDDGIAVTDRRIDNPSAAAANANTNPAISRCTSPSGA